MQRHGRYLAGLFLLALLSARSRLANSGDTVTHDYSQFERFEFRQESGFWFCPLEGLPYVATIVRSGASGYLFRESVVAESATNPDSCIAMSSSGSCFVEQQLPNRQLTAEEVHRFKTVFSRIAVRKLPPPKCQGQLVIDYCRTLRCRWDDHVHNDAECQKDSFGKDQIDELVTLMKDLHGRSTAPSASSR